MTEHELVDYHEKLSDIMSCCKEQSYEKVAQDLVVNFREWAVDLALAILDEAKKQQKAVLFKPPQ